MMTLANKDTTEGSRNSSLTAPSNTTMSGRVTFLLPSGVVDRTTSSITPNAAAVTRLPYDFSFPQRVGVASTINGHLSLH